MSKTSVYQYLTELVASETERLSIAQAIEEAAVVSVPAAD
jgi:hypothetical protein